MHGNRASVETDVEFPSQSGRAVWRVMGVFESQLKSLAKAFAFVRRIHRCTISCCNMKVSFLNDQTDCYIIKENKLTINTPAGLFGYKYSPNFLLQFCITSVRFAAILDFCTQARFKDSVWHDNVRYRTMPSSADTCDAHAIQFLVDKISRRVMLFSTWK